MAVPSMHGKIVLVTGGNSGIGKHTAAALAAAGAKVVITARDPARGEAALAEIRRRSGSDTAECMRLDLASFASIRAFAAEFLGRFDRLDVLVNNAGGVLSDRRTTAEGFEMTFGVNHLGHFLLTDLLLDRLKASAPARVVNVASDAHRQARGGLDFDDLNAEHDYTGWTAYARSKLANILFTRELARRLDGTGVTANSLHPGTVATGFGADDDLSRLWSIGIKLVRPFFKTPEAGARTSIWAASAPELEGVTGAYFAKSRRATPARTAQDDEAARRLWQVSESMVARATAS